MLREGVTSALYFKTDIDDLDKINVLSMVIAQNGKIVIEKKLDDCTKVYPDTLLFQLSEEESLRLNGDERARLQIRVKYTDGTTDASEIIDDFVSSILRK